MVGMYDNTRTVTWTQSDDPKIILAVQAMFIVDQWLIIVSPHGLLKSLEEFTPFCVHYFTSNEQMSDKFTMNMYFMSHCDLLLIYYTPEKNNEKLLEKIVFCF